MTATTISIGFIDVVNNDQLMNSMGLKGANFGDNKSQTEAVVSDLNARGGIFGRKIVPVFATYDSVSSETDDTQYARICATFTQDHHVFAALIPLNAPLSFATCLANAHVLYVSDALLQQDETTFTKLSPYLYSGLLSVSRGALALASALHVQGFFTATTRTGVVTFDRPEFQRAYHKYLEPTLASYGVKVIADASLRTDSTQDETADISSAVLKFAALHIDRVIFLTAEGGAATIFMGNAQSQNYHPHYGLASPDAPAFQAQNVPSSQLSGAMGAGWLPAEDVADAQGPPLTPPEKRCLAIQAKHGNSFSGRSGALTALAACDLVWLFEAAARSAGPSLTTAAWVTGILGLHRQHQTVLTFATDFNPAHHDGAAAYRPLAYGDSCRCFRYTLPPQSLN